MNRTHACTLPGMCSFHTSKNLFCFLDLSKAFYRIWLVLFIVEKWNSMQVLEAA